MRDFLLSTLIAAALVPFQASAEMRITQADFLSKVQSQNLDLKIEAAKAEVATAHSKGLGITPPVIGFSRTKEDSGDTARGFEVSQTIPFPAKFINDHAARKYQAESQEETRLGRKKEIFAEAKFHYFALWSKQEKISLLQEKKRVLENHIKLSRSSARSDSFSGVHVLKAESEQDLLENEILTAEQELREIRSEVALFLAADARALEWIAEEPMISAPPVDAPIQFSHQFRALDLSLEGFKSRKAEAVSSWFPDINFRFKQQGATALTPGYQEVMVGVTLPFLFFWETSATHSKASAQKTQAEAEVEKQKRLMESERSLLLTRAQALKKQLDVLMTKLIPRAEKRVKLVHNLAPRDMETLQDHLETMEALPELKMKALDLRSEYEHTVVKLEKYLTVQGAKDHE